MHELDGRVMRLAHEAGVDLIRGEELDPFGPAAVAGERVKMPTPMMLPTISAIAAGRPDFCASTPAASSLAEPGTSGGIRTLSAISELLASRRRPFWAAAFIRTCATGERPASRACRAVTQMSSPPQGDFPSIPRLAGNSRKGFAD